MAREDAIHYPITDMQSLATSQRKILNDAWDTHQTHLQQRILTQASTLPGHAADTFHSHMTAWHQTLQDHYDAMHTFLNVLDGGAGGMQTQDTNVGNDFNVPGSE